MRSKTVVSTIGLSFLAFALVSIQWFLFLDIALLSDRIMFGMIGDLKMLGLSGVGIDPAPLASNTPNILYMMFQLKSLRAVSLGYTNICNRPASEA